MFIQVQVWIKLGKCIPQKVLKDKIFFTIILYMVVDTSSNVFTHKYMTNAF